jgi:hypothetical protein
MTDFNPGINHQFIASSDYQNFDSGNIGVNVCSRAIRHEFGFRECAYSIIEISQSQKLAGNEIPPWPE